MNKIIYHSSTGNQFACQVYANFAVAEIPNPQTKLILYLSAEHFGRHFFISQMAEKNIASSKGQNITKQSIDHKLSYIIIII